MSLIVGVETSCDDTSIAVLRDWQELSLVTQTHLEGVSEFGGVVPEIASRQHISSISPVYSAAVKKAGINALDLDAIAVTYGPGLAGSLNVGLSFAQGLATGLAIPLLGVNHMEAHVQACWIGCDPEETPLLPAICLVVSGGHTDLTLMREDGRHYLLGRTRDDAAGEAFDKVARVLGLGFPGGPAIEDAAAKSDQGGQRAYTLPRAWLKGSYDFSFSGIKTAVYRACAGRLGPAETSAIFNGEDSSSLLCSHESAIQRMAAGFQAAVIDVLVSKTVQAAEDLAARSVILAGGVAANHSLRSNMGQALDIPLFMPTLPHCMDNGAMIAIAGSFMLESGYVAPPDLDIEPGLELATVRYSSS